MLSSNYYTTLPPFVLVVSQHKNNKLSLLALCFKAWSRIWENYSGQLWSQLILWSDKYNKFMSLAHSLNYGLFLLFTLMTFNCSFVVFNLAFVQWPNVFCFTFLLYVIWYESCHPINLQCYSTVLKNCWILNRK